MAGKKKVKDLFLVGRKRSLESKKPKPCQFCKIQVQGFSERLEHERKCNKRTNGVQIFSSEFRLNSIFLFLFYFNVDLFIFQGNFVAAGGAKAASAATEGAAANDPNQVSIYLYRDYELFFSVIVAFF